MGDPRLVIGCMTGTSLDALDAAAVEIVGTGLGMTARVMGAVSEPLGALAPRLRRVAEQELVTAGEIAAVSRDFALFHVGVIRRLLLAVAPRSAALICAHGQTVYHAPPVSWQLLNAAPIAAALGVPVVSDLRAADLAAGGQGAPITPLADFILFRGAGARVVVNLGGFCNITVLPASPPGADAGLLADQVRGWDACACNQPLDAVARAALGLPYDPEGRHAAAGVADEGHGAALMRLLAAQGGGGRSLGTGDEVAGWVAATRGLLGPDDLARTACRAVAGAVAASIVSGGGGGAEVLLAGGGCRNRVLVQELEAALGRPVGTTSSAGVEPEVREAAAMAVLGALCADGVPITLPGVTGVAAPAPVAGVWTHPARKGQPR